VVLEIRRRADDVVIERIAKGEDGDALK